MFLPRLLLMFRDVTPVCLHRLLFISIHTHAHTHTRVLFLQRINQHCPDMPISSILLSLQVLFPLVRNVLTISLLLPNICSLRLISNNWVLFESHPHLSSLADISKYGGIVVTDLQRILQR